jgi:hypothetical protein
MHRSRASNHQIGQESVIGDPNYGQALGVLAASHTLSAYGLGGHGHRGADR